MLLGDMQMIDFSRSTFTWKSHPCTPDPHYRWQGGFVGEPGQVYHVRFMLDARCALQHPDRAEPLELFLGSPCRSEYTIARRNLFQVPSAEWRMAFSRACQVTIGASVGDVEEMSPRPLTEVFADHTIDIRQVAAPRRLADAADIAAATLDGCLLNGISSYRDQDTGCMVTVEYPVNVMNLNVNAVFMCCKFMLPHMISQGSGSIINISSGAATGSSVQSSAYSTSKAALEIFSLVLAKEVGPQGISVVAYRPGRIKTEGAVYVNPKDTDWSPWGDLHSCGPSIMWLAQQTPETFTGQVVDRADFGKTWGSNG